MKLKRIMIAAPKSASGKTMLVCALLMALKNKGISAVAYKCGPDYIDPLFHEKIIGVPSKNLDTFFTGEEKTIELMLKNRTEDDFALIEGVMGLFDGLGGVRTEGSSYHLAEVTKTPIILAVDAKGMGHSLIPLIAGFLKYDKKKLIRGVILNRIPASFYAVIKPLIEKELQITVFGYLPELAGCRIESRYLGLATPDESEDIIKKLGVMSEEFEKTVSLEKIMETAQSASELKCVPETADGAARGFVPEEYGIMAKGLSGGDTRAEKEKPIIAVAKDEAFCFYYEDNLLMLKESGAELRYFSPIHDKEIPADCDALLIGGGYPELYAKELSGNITMLNSIKSAFENGIPIVAECGGFMYLHSGLKDKDANNFAMAGIVPAVCCYKDKSVRFGYIEISEKKSFFLPEGTRIKGHEFHYYDSTENGRDATALKPFTGREYPCVLAGENYWLGFPHLYYPSNPAFAESFVKKAAKYKLRKKS